MFIFQARIVCEKLDGQLFVAHSADALSQLTRLRNSALEPSPYLFVWAGYTDQESEGEYEDIYLRTPLNRWVNSIEYESHRR